MRTSGLIALLFLSACAYTLKIKDGDTAYERMQYAKAVAFYKKDLDRAKGRVQEGRIALKLAEAYSKMNQPAQALPYYQLAWNNQAGIQALKGKAYTLKMLERYDEAIEAFKQLGEEIGTFYEYRRDIEACERAIVWLKASEVSPFLLENLPINSLYADYAPFPMKDGRLVFTSDRPSPQNKELYAWTGQPFADILVGQPTSDLPESMLPGFLATLNTPAHEGVLRMDASENIFFTRCGEDDLTTDRYCRIFYMSKEGENWKDPEMLPFCTGTFNYGHPFPSPDGQFLYFASDDPNGLGGYDLYVTLRTKDGWLEPVMLPPSINTPGDEMFPWMDGDTLYFASDYHIGMGGLDIFRTHKLGGKAWTLPVNMLPPINSGADDFGLVWLPTDPGNLKRGYLSSTRPGGKGNDDIYFIREHIPVEIPPIVDTISTYAFELQIFVLSRIFQDPANPNSPVLGRKPLNNANLRISQGVDTLLFSTPEKPGLLAIEPGKQYEIEAWADGYLRARSKFDARDLSIEKGISKQLYTVEILLEQVFYETEIILENIYYDYDKWDIRADAEPTLKKLATTLLANPEIQIELGSHTDCRGSAAYNIDLSQRRAQSAVNYLIAQGVQEDRLRAMGFGKSKLAIDCICSRCTETEHQVNRRTTFRILEE